MQRMRLQRDVAAVLTISVAVACLFATLLAVVVMVR
jgi:hypothetical protein